MSKQKTVSILFATQAAGPGPRAAPFGAARVVSALRAAPLLAGRVSVDILEAPEGESPASLAGRIALKAPDIVGLSMYSWNAGLLEAAGALLKAKHPETLIVAGGPDASSRPGRLIESGHSDLVVAGEGELAMVDIALAMLEGRPLPGPLIRATLVDPAALTSPWLDGTLEAEAWEGAALELTRGCPYRCAFCFESKGESRLRRFPAETVARELARFEASRAGGSGIDEVFVLDPTFNADDRRMAEAVRAFGRYGPSLRYFIELRAELLTAEQARHLATIDCSVQIGLQSADPAVLALVNRSFDPKLFARKLRLLDDEGIIYGLDLIYGLPGDDLPGFRRSLDYALGLGPNHLDVFRLAVLPGTALFDNAASLGLVFERDAPYHVVSTPGFSAADLGAAERLARSVDILYTKGRAVMWFRSVAALAKTRPSSMAARFADYMEASGLEPVKLAEAPHRAIEEAQLGFLSALLAKTTAAATGTATTAHDAARRTATPAGTAAAALDAARRTATPAGTAAAALDAALDLVRVSGAWTRALAEGDTTEMRLGWDPEDLLDYATADIAEFAKETRRVPGLWLCEPGPEGPRFRKAPSRR